MKKINFPNLKNKKWLALSLTIFLILCLLGGTALAFDQAYHGKIYPGIKIAGIKLGGLPLAEAQKVLRQEIEKFNQTGQIFSYQNKSVIVYPTTLPTADLDLSHEIITFNLDATLNRAYQIGRGKNFFDGLWQKIKFIAGRKNIRLDIGLVETEIIKILENTFGYLEVPKKNPTLDFGNGTLEIKPEEAGITFNYPRVLNQVKTNLSNLIYQPLELSLSLVAPDLKKEEVMFLKDKISILTQPKTLNIYMYDESGKQILYSWIINTDLMKNWLAFKKGSWTSRPELSFAAEKINVYLETLAAQVNRPTKEAKFKLENNRVIEFQAAQNGREIDIVKTLENFEEDLIKQEKNQTQLAIKITQPQNIDGSTNEMGIRELIGMGKSNFSGSPQNRRQNIRVGAQSLNGLLIKPGEEFSLNQSLGEIIPEKGYLPELVIKGNKTIPEYGGGLCQVATTAFRLAINSGLKVTQRQPHAYRVSYYEPTGTDATIYPPSPDVKFVNDTPNYLLLQTRIEENDLIFEFWGTNDGRQVATTTPKIFNIAAPGPTQYIETTDLEPGKIKCSEIAHNGADAEFKRNITYANGEIFNEVWKSHYRPWQAVCLIGVKEISAATTTPSLAQ